jgi:hypothetical protein
MEEGGKEIRYKRGKGNKQRGVWDEDIKETIP